MMSANRRYMQWGCGLLFASLAALAVVGLSNRRIIFRLLATRLTKSQLIANVGGGQVASVLRDHDRAEAILIQPPSDDRVYPPHEYVPLGTSQPVATEVATDLSRILLDPSEHAVSLPKSCIPRYGVRISFFARQDRVDVYFCFECAILAVYLNDKPAGGLSFDAAYRRLITDVRKIYPQHAGLAKLLAQWRL